MKKKITRKGSGRTKGSFSFVSIPVTDILAKHVDSQTMSDLVNKFPGLSTPVTASRKWAESFGFIGLVAGPAGSVHGKIEGLTPETRSAAKVVDLDQD